MKTKLYIILAGLFLLTVQLKAQSPNAINYQGVARNASGTIIPHQLIGLEFTIHQSSASGTIVYQETDTATTNQFGLFTTAIGEGTVLSGTMAGIGWAAHNEYLDVAMDPLGGTSYNDMGTQQLLSVPYSLYSAKSGGGNWTASGNNIYNNNTGSVGIGTTTPAINSELDVASTHTYGASFSADSLSANTIVLNAVYKGTGKYDAIGVEGTCVPIDGYGYGAEFIGGYEGSENIAIGATAGYTYYGSFNGVLSSAASTNYGAFGYAQSNGGANFGISGQAVDDGLGSSYGVFGNGSSTTGVAYGLYGEGSPFGGYGFASGTGVINSNIGTAYGSNTFVYGFDGEVTGASGSNSTLDNVGLFGVATNPDADYNNGSFNYGANSTVNTYGSYSIAQTNSADNYTISVYGEINPDGGTSFYGDYAGYFDGDVTVSGMLSKGGGSFKIDDPLDPANKYLYHSFVESPDMMNIYNGEVTTDANGDATVTLPQYFQIENKDFKYQLTVIGQFAQAIVATRIDNNQFTIKTDKPNVAVSWQVTGVRNDPFANDHRIVAEVEKKSIEKGHYLYPQYYGQPKTMSIGYLMSAVNKNKSLSIARTVHNPIAPPQRPTPGANSNNNQLH